MIAAVATGEGEAILIWVSSEKMYVYLFKLEGLSTATLCKGVASQGARGGGGEEEEEEEVAEEEEEVDKVVEEEEEVDKVAEEEEEVDKVAVADVEVVVEARAVVAEEEEEGRAVAAVDVVVVGRVEGEGEEDAEDVEEGVDKKQEDSAFFRMLVLLFCTQAIFLYYLAQGRSELRTGPFLTKIFSI